MKREAERYRIAIVDDQQDCMESLKENLCRYASENGFQFQITTSNHSIDFVSDYAANYDILFLDVVMPEMDGMATAERIRKLDEDVCIIFVTNYAQYAIHGYEVQAFSYILKPFLYGNLVLTMNKAIRQCRNRRNNDFVLQTPEGTFRFPLHELIYVESQEHHLIYHAVGGTVRKRGKLSELEEELGKKGFCRCGVSFLVNLRCVQKIAGQTLQLSDGTVLMISRRYKNEFLARFASFVGKGGTL